MLNTFIYEQTTAKKCRIIVEKYSKKNIDYGVKCLSNIKVIENYHFRRGTWDEI